MKRNTLTTALLAGLTGSVGVANIAVSDVHINPDGLGQTLIYPYYTVRGGNISLMTVVNTTDTVKAVKVRFLEGKASAEVLDFNLYMSPYDVWTGVIVDDGTAGRLHTDDTTCTAPRIPLGFEADDGVQFRNFQYVNDAAADNSLDRTREGYIELIEMGVVEELADPTVTGAEANATHISGVVSDTACGAIGALWAPIGGIWTNGPDTDILPPEGGLFGGISYVDVAQGRDSTVNATALEDFSEVELHSNPGSIQPNLAQVNPEQSIVFNRGTVVNSYWGDQLDADYNPADAVSALFMHDSFMNEYVLDAGTASATDWVVTFPTKRFYVPATGAPVDRPFTAPLTTFGACEPIAINIWDREEQTPSTPPGEIDFSPLPPGVDPTIPTLCWESSVISFLDATADEAGVTSGLLGSTLVSNIGVAQAEGYENGWVQIDFFPELGHKMASDTTTGFASIDYYDGLPMMGFRVESYTNAGAQPGLLAQYTGLFNHRATRFISSETP